MNKKAIIPIGIGVAIIIVGIIVIYNQESEIPKSDIEMNIENKTSENQLIDEIIDEKLNEIEKKSNENYFKPAPRDWQRSGPFEIDRSKYLIGERVFIRIGDLESTEKGQIAFLKPLNDTHYSVFQTIPFDGSTKAAFNYFVDIKLSKIRGICSMDDIIGEWTIVFRGTEHPNLKFELTNEILPGEEDSFVEPLC